jgi:integrase
VGEKRRGHNEGTVYERRDAATGKVIGYQAQITIPGTGGKRKGVSGKTKAEVQRKLREAQVASAQGTLVVGRDQTVSQWLTHWVEHMVRPTKSPSTYENYEISVRKHINPEIGHVRLGELQPEHFQRLYAAATKKGLAPRTVKKLHLVMHKSLADAVLLKKLPHNPADHVGPLYLPREKGQSAQRALTPEQIATLFSVTRDDVLHDLWFTLASTGMRLGEALGITWPDVDLVQGTIHIHRSIKREKNRGLILREHTKTQAGTRTIEISSFTVEVLQHHCEAQRFAKQSASRWEGRENYRELVFTTQFGTPLDPSDTWKYFLLALKEAGLPRIRIHDLRHSAATNMLLNGEDIKAVSEHLGHRDVSTTLRVYYHVTRSKRRDAVERLGQLYASVVPQPQ